MRYTSIDAHERLRTSGRQRRRTETVSSSTRRGGVDHSWLAVAHKRAVRARELSSCTCLRVALWFSWRSLRWRGRAPASRAAECALLREARTRAAEGLTEAFEAAGFEVARGAMWIFGHRDIDPDCEDCYYANPTSTYGCPMLVRRDATRRRRERAVRASLTHRLDPLRQPVTDDPRWLLRASASTSRASASSPDPDANVAAARRPVLSSRVASRDSDRDLDPAPSSARRGELRASNVGPDEVLRPSSSTPSAPLAAFRAARRRREEYREASSTLDAPALGLARVPEDALARILPDGPSSRASGAFARTRWSPSSDARHPRRSTSGSRRTCTARIETDPFEPCSRRYPTRLRRRLRRRDPLAFLATEHLAGAVPFDADGTRTGVLRGVPCWDSGFAALDGG